MLLIEIEIIVDVAIQRGDFVLEIILLTASVSIQTVNLISIPTIRFFLGIWY